MADWLPTDVKSATLALWLDPSTNVVGGQNLIGATQITERGPNAFVFDNAGLGATGLTTQATGAPGGAQWFAPDIIPGTLGLASVLPAAADYAQEQNRTEYFVADMQGSNDPYLKGTWDLSNDEADSNYDQWRDNNGGQHRVGTQLGTDTFTFSSDAGNFVSSTKFMVEQVIDDPQGYYEAYYNSVEYFRFNDLFSAGGPPPAQGGAFAYGFNNRQSDDGLRFGLNNKMGDWIVYTGGIDDGFSTPTLHIQERTAVTGYLAQKFNDPDLFLNSSLHPHLFEAPQTNYSHFVVEDLGGGQFGGEVDLYAPYFAGISPPIAQVAAPEVYDKSLIRNGNTVVWATDGDNLTALSGVNGVLIDGVAWPLTQAVYISSGDKTELTFTNASAPAWTPYARLTVEPQLAGGGTAPVFNTNATLNVDEGSQLNATLNLSAGDSPVTLSITGGGDAALFEVVQPVAPSVNGQLRWLGNGTAPDYENPLDDPAAPNSYRVNVTATNAFGSDTKFLTVQVQNVVEAPIIEQPAILDFAEGAVVIVVVGASNTTDPVTTWSIIGGADQASFFGVPTGEGEFLLAWATPDTAPPAVGSYEVIVRAENSAGFDDETITINVSPVSGIAQPVKLKARSGQRLSYLPTTTGWTNFTPASDDPADDVIDFNTDDAFSYDPTTGVLQIPAQGKAGTADPPTAWMVKGYLNARATHNNRMNLQARFSRTSGDGVFARLNGSCYMRNNANPTGVIQFGAIIAGSTLPQQLQLEWKRDNGSGGSPAAYLEESGVSVVPLWGDAAAIFTSQSTQWFNDVTATAFTGFSEAYNSSAAGEIALVGDDTFDLDAGAKYLVWIGNYAEGSSGRTQHWTAIEEDGSVRDETRAYSYSRDGNNDENGEFISGIVDASSAAKSLRNVSFRGPSTYASFAGGAGSAGSVNISNPEHTVFVLRLSATTKLFWGDNTGAGAQPISGANAAIDIKAAENFQSTNVDFLSTGFSTDVTSASPCSLLTGFQVNGAYTVNSGSRASRGIRILKNDALIPGEISGGFGRGSQGGQSTYGWGCGGIGLDEIEVGDTLNLQSWDFGDNGVVSVVDGWASWWGIDLNSMIPSGGGGGPADPITGDLDEPIDPIGIAAAGSLEIAGAASSAIDPPQVTANGSALLRADLSVPLGGPSLGAGGGVAIAASAAITLLAITGSADAELPVGGAAGGQIEAVESSATATLAIAATSGRTINPVQTATAAALAVTGAGGGAISEPSLSATGGLRILGRTSAIFGVQLPPIDLASLGFADLSAQLSATLPSVSATATGSLLASGGGSLVTVVGPVQNNGAASLAIAGTAQAQPAPVSVTATAKISLEGAASNTLPGIATQGAGALRIGADGATEIASPASGIGAALSIAANASPGVGEVVAAALGSQLSGGQLAETIEPVEADAAASVRIRGAAGVNVPTLDLTGQSSTSLAGSVADQIGPVAAAAVGTIELLGNGAAQAGQIATDIAAGLSLRGNAISQVAPVALSGNGLLTQTGSGGAIIDLQPVEAVAAAKVDIAGAGSSGVGAVALGGLSGLGIASQGAVTIPAIEAAATGALALVAASETAIAPVDVVAIGSTALSGSSSITLPAFGLVGIGQYGLLEVTVPASRQTQSAPRARTSASAAINRATASEPQPRASVGEGDRATTSAPRNRATIAQSRFRATASAGKRRSS